MEILVGVTRDQQGEDAIALGLALAKAGNATVAFAHVYPTAFDFVGPAHVDHEWRQYLMDEAQETLEWAKKRTEGHDNVSFVTSGHKSSGVGLTKLAGERGSRVIVIGSAPGASEGRIAIGSTANQLFHESPIPVSVAPMGYANWAPSQIGRVVLAFRKGNSLVQELVRMARESNQEDGLALKIITVLDEPSHFRRLSVRSGGKGEELLQTLRDQAQERLDRAAKEIAGELAVTPETEVLEADGFGHAIARFNFDDADLLMMGTPSSAPLSRVFLSDATYNMIRSATVPIVVSPLRA